MQQGAILKELEKKKKSTQYSNINCYSPSISADMPEETKSMLKKIELDEVPQKVEAKFIIGAPQAGKHIVAERIKARLPHITAILNENDFYIPLEGQLQFSQDYNYDDPVSIDWNQLLTALNDLKQGKEIFVPSYSKEKKCRNEDFKSIKPAKIIIIWGKFLFTTKAISEQINLKVYVDAQSDVRLARRIQEHLEYGESIEKIIDYYMKYCKPSVEKYQQKEKLMADVIIPNYGEICNYIAVDIMIDYIEASIRGKEQLKQSQNNGPNPFVTKRKGSMDLEQGMSQN